MQSNLESTRPEKLYIILAMTLFEEYARRRAYQATQSRERTTKA